MSSAAPPCSEDHHTPATAGGKNRENCPLRPLAEEREGTRRDISRIGRSTPLRDAVLRTAQASGIVGVRGVLVHALSPAAKRFFETHGLRDSPANPMTLVVALQDALATLRGE